MLTEQIANDNILNKEINQRQMVEQELTRKKVEYEKRKQISDEVIQQLKKERQAKDQRIQELEQKLEMKIEVLPK